MALKSSYEGKMRKIEVDVEDKRYLINVVNMAKDLGDGLALVSSVRTTFTAPDTGKKYPIKVLVAARPTLQLVADESTDGTTEIDGLVIKDLAIIPLKER